ncbi:MAG: MazG nucleotide pyrophosphohydrolase domain-containing protein [Alphaproteobacteria bacterium]
MDDLDKILSDYKHAVDIGFYWDDPLQIIKQIESELNEVRQELQKPNSETLQEELSDVLHAWITLVDFCGFDVKETIACARKKFEKRFDALHEIIQEEGASDFKNFSQAQKLLFWEKAKQKEQGLS